ncbi:Txe/YoeB family addiction module toxin [Rickettsia conorii]|uniref:Txe/YoeB family addiction module toxin n=1 Tax=Rickettsia conorii TaxID=781 RepID=UPI002260AD14|nr:Txe/YoeB family addiction module toxin [Rickettsia conorii]UZW38811.1 Txe/YoeB family addiction module toxin [Rickettsia conorii subsp. heilongjiangensis]
MIEIEWTLEAAEDLVYWKKYDIKKYERIKLLIKNIQEASFTGIGKPESLKHILSGLWSRRINHEHRLIYSVNTKQIIIYNCRFHYKN